MMQTPPGFAQPLSPGTDIDALARRIAEMLSGDAGGAIKPLLENRQQREQQDWERKFAGEMGGLSDVQRYYFMSRQSPEERLQALATVNMVNRQKMLKGAGLDPQGSFVRGQRPNETADQYTAAMQGASQAAETRRKATRDRLLAQAQADKEANRKAGVVPFARGVIGTPADSRPPALRAATAEQIAQGRRAPMDDAEMRDAQSVIASGGRSPLPAPENTYRALTKWGDEPSAVADGYNTPAQALTAADSLGEQDRIAAIRKAMQRLMPDELAALGGQPALGGAY